MQKMCGILLPCQRGKQMSWGVSPSFPCTFSLPAQVSRERSRGEADGAMPALGAFGSRSSGSFCIHLLWSCQQVKHSVLLRAAETPCALSSPLAELPWPCLAPSLGWGRFNPLGSPSRSPSFGQAWGAVLSYLARGKKPHQLLAIAKTPSTDFASTAEQWQSRQSERCFQSLLAVRPKPDHLQVSTPSFHRVPGMEDVYVKGVGSPQQQAHHCSASWSSLGQEPDRSQMSSLMDYHLFPLSVHPYLAGMMAPASAAKIVVQNIDLNQTPNF